MRAFVERAGAAAGLAPDRAGLLAQLLAGNDLRGNFSHGSLQIATYARLMRDGDLNPRPDVSIVRESPVSLLVDGDGGLGYFPSYDGTKLIIRKAEESGVAILVTRNHGHFGAAGLYARLAVDAGLCVYVTSGHQLALEPGSPHYAAAGGSPMAFGMPADPHVILDFGAMHDLYSGNPDRDTLARMAPGLVLRSIGLGTICQMWGGFLSGLTSDPTERPWERKGANQGALVMCFKPGLFTDEATVRTAVNDYAARVEATAPIADVKKAYLPGGIEAERELEWSSSGIPVSDEHAEALEQCAADFSIEPPPWSAVN